MGYNRLTAAGVAVVMGGGIMAVPTSARASEEGRKNTALALGAAAGYLLLTQKNKLPGLVAGAGAAFAFKRYDDSVKDRHRRQRYGYNDGSYNDRYRNDRYNDRYNDDRYGYGSRYDGSYRYDGGGYGSYNDRNYNDRYDDRYYTDRYSKTGSNSGYCDDRYYNDRYSKTGYNSGYYDDRSYNDRYDDRYYNDRSDDCYRSRRR